MTGFQWFQAIGITVTLISFLVGFPVTIKGWNEDRKYADRIELNSKVIPETTEEGVKRVLAEDTDENALRLAALRMFPPPRWTRRIGDLATFLYLAALAELIVLPILGFGWCAVTYALITYIVGLTLGLSVVSRIWRYHANRNAFGLLGAPENFRAARKSRVPYQNAVLHIYWAYYQRSMKIIRRAAADRQNDGSTEGLSATEWRKSLRPELTDMWNQIIDSQERYYRTKRRRGPKVRLRARRLRKIRKQRNRDARRQLWKDTMARRIAERRAEREHRDR
ncbi:hypothetical protein DDT46_16730 [Mycobacteroides abscessus]|uniref:hypothetical protein n=1 Tax=Mycobacteroides abscessus TaxID=36809 RepID=UPI000C2690F3|nr:hypothetical protein [Mycobacteroides abscessus]AWG65276.1 hypothetical protein DDT46_16730 [Mycobacteroides abscessus]